MAAKVHPGPLPPRHPGPLPPDAPGSPFAPKPEPQKRPGNPTTKGIARTIQVIAGLLTVGLVLMTMSSLLGPMLRKEATVQHEISETVTALDIRGDRGSVDVRAAREGESAHVEEQVTWSFGRPDTKVAVDAATLRLTDACGSTFVNDSCQIRWTVVVPADADVTIQYSVGDVTVADMAGDLDLRSDVGQVGVTGATSDSISATSSVGEVQITAAEAPTRVRVDSSVGEAKVSVPRGETYRVDARSDVGTVRNSVGNDTSSDHEVSVTSSVGDVTVEYAN